MWRTIERDGQRESTPPVAEQARPEVNHESENWPTPGEMAFESGVVIAGALAVALIMDLILAAIGIPSPV